MILLRSELSAFRPRVAAAIRFAYPNDNSMVVLDRARHMS
jgi:hypothetical protein